jgi:CRP-like cAMP-binding protein
MIVLRGGWMATAREGALEAFVAVMAAKPSSLTTMRSGVTPAAPAFEPESLSAFCLPLAFSAGDVLRRKGQHYVDMFLMVEGAVEVDLETAGSAPLTLSGAGTPIGEIGFLRGCAATATVTARTAGSGLAIDDERLALLERERPELASALLRHLALTAEQRTSFNLTFASGGGTYARSRSVEVLLCRNDEMLERAQRLRYEVYCQELKRQSPYADHDKRTISDQLDDFGHTFIAVEDGQTIGTLRGNLAWEGSLGVLEELYGMRQSANYPQAVAVCTKFVVRKAKRGGPAAMRLISAIVRFGVERGVKDCYIDCVPTLMPYYKALGFKVAGRKFFHRENGPSFPMILDVARHGRRLSTEGGARDHLKLFVRAQFIRLADRMRRRWRQAGAVV